MSDLCAERILGDVPANGTNDLVHLARQCRWEILLPARLSFDLLCMVTRGLNALADLKRLDAEGGEEEGAALILVSAFLGAVPGAYVEALSEGRRRIEVLQELIPTLRDGYSRELARRVVSIEAPDADAELLMALRCSYASLLGSSTTATATRGGGSTGSGKIASS